MVASRWGEAALLPTDHIVGIVATFLGQAMGVCAAGQSAGFIGAVIGAIIVLFVYHMIRGRRGVV
jgi:uncharacterized membrane protein YeaQ/YmgE (transglycosylase-associated protein family)